MSSYGQNLLKRYLSLMLDDVPLEDYRPDWLCGMELDLYFEALNLGVEFQGDQHYIPVYGRQDCWAQRRRDRSKKQICEERGVRFIRVDAIDLEYTRLTFKLKRACGDVRGLKKFIRRPQIRGRLRSLNADSIAYRKTLNENFGAITSRRKGNSRRKAKYEWLTANGYHATRPLSPEERKAARAAKRAATAAHKARLAQQGLKMLPAGAPAVITGSENDQLIRERYGRAFDRG
jgi:hypothetical protein